MKCNLFVACAVLLLFLSGFRGHANEIGAPEIQESIRKSAAFLWARQADDGGWHSTRYGLLRSGQALTPFVLNALLQSPESQGSVEKENARRAVAFIKAHLTDDGALGKSDKTLYDYPNYATALAVQALSRAGSESETIERMTRCLLRQQFSGEIWREHKAFGAWGMGAAPLTGAGARTPQEPGHVDLSMTRYALEALRAADPDGHAPGIAAAFKHAQTFLRRCQNRDTDEDNVPHDGGFYFSTIVLEANKAGPEQTRFKSYGTPSADGILSLLACGVRRDDPRVTAAHRWLVEHHRIGAAPGFAAEPAKRWDTGLQFYYYAAAARVFKTLGAQKKDASDARAELTAFLVKSQRADGSWANENFLVKEDDPLIATVFALSALLNLQ